MSLSRRTFLAALAAGACAPAVNAHTMYNQWVVYRQKHLLIGCHRKDMTTYELSLEMAEALGHLLPEAASRPARAPHPQRLASLLGTRQLELATLSVETAERIKAGSGPFKPYGAVPLVQIANLGAHILVSHAAFTPHHAWLVASALDQSGYLLASGPETESFTLHDGVSAYLDGMPMEDLVPA